MSSLIRLKRLEATAAVDDCSTRIADLERKLSECEVSSGLTALERQFNGITGLSSAHSSRDGAARSADVDVSCTLLKQALPRIESHAKSLKLIQESYAECFDSMKLKATVDERVRLAKLLQEVLSSARRARTFHRQVTELLAAYGVVVDAATELTLRIEEKLVAGGEGIASAAAASKA